MGWFKGNEQRRNAPKTKTDTEVNESTPQPEKQPKRFSRWTQEQRDRMTARARSSARYNLRWRMMSGGLDHEIDLNNPQVRLEWELCDIENLRLVYRGRYRDEFLNKLPEDTRAIYFEKDNEGNSYADMVEDPKFFRGFLSACGVLVRGEKHAIDKLMRELDEQVKAEEDAQKINEDTPGYETPLQI